MIEAYPKVIVKIFSKRNSTYFALSVLIIAACAGFICRFELLFFLSLFLLTLLLALKFEKQLFYFLVATLPVSFELVHSAKDLLPGLTGGVNANGLLAILLVGAVLPVISIKAFKAGWRPSKSIILLAAYIAWAAFTILYSEYPLVGAKYAGYLIYPLVYFVFVRFLVITNAMEESMVFRWMLASAVVSAVIGYLLFIFDFHFISTLRDEYVFGAAIKRFVNPLGYGSSHWALSMALYALIAAETASQEKRKKLLYISALIICSLSLVLTYTRIPFIALFLYLFFLTIARKNIILSSLVCVLTLAVIFFTPMGLRFNFFGFAIEDFNKAQVVLDESKMKIDERESAEEAEFEESNEPTRLDQKRYLFQTALSGRGVLFKTSFNLAMASPVWGYGLGAADYKLNSFLKEGMGVTAPMINVHSVILRSRIETGFLGSGLLIAFLIMLFVELIQNRRRGNRYVTLGILVCFYFCIGLLVEPLLSWYRFSVSIFFVIFAIALSKRDNISNSEIRSGDGADKPSCCAGSSK